MLVPLWQSDRNTQDSLIFELQPNEIALLVATGFTRDRVRSAVGEINGRQFACLHRLILGYDPDADDVMLEPCNACDYLYNRNGVKAYDEPVSINCCLVGLSQCHNTMLWALPGKYYFHLNDKSAVGQAQIWIEIYKPEDLPLALLGEYTGVCHG